MVWSWRSISDRESVNARADIRKLRNAEAVERAAEWRISQLFRFMPR
jgi:Tfp pilus assembly protein PilX